MRRFSRFIVVSVLAVAGSVQVVSPACADLFEYVNTPDEAFSWKKTGQIRLPDGTVYNLELVSQTWQGIVWKHGLQVCVPRDVTPGSKMFLWNQGGSPSLLSAAFGMELAKKMKAPVALLFGIPNQPLLDGRREDALIAETFVRYLKTKDETWPLLFPMVKSLVRAMDALQAFARAEWNVNLTSFIVSGGSKRGWTTWLTAIADARVIAIAPLVIDTLNMPAQLPHQLKSFGAYSEQIADYTRAKLVPPPDTPEGKRLWSLVDPYFHRDKIKVPVMIINGANDPYWTVDALNFYWDELKTDKWVLYVPNAGHNLEQKHADGKKDRDRALAALAAFVRHQFKENPMPRLEWEHGVVMGWMRLTVRATPAPTQARLWVAESTTRDFRKSEWKSRPATILNQDTIIGEVMPPASGFVAFFGEFDYEIEGLRHQLSTQVRVVGKN